MPCTLGRRAVPNPVRRQFDHAVLDAYGWACDVGDEEILGQLLALNLERAGTLDPRMVLELVHS